jgi:NAD(P)-dependent dehydrogenase (short-subunit alcohol dehydrogenase family)
VETLAARTLDAFGAVHIVCNNAGVIGRFAPVWQQSAAEWQWVYGVNLWGVIHGVSAFVPIMLRQDTEAHIVNTASEASFTARPFTGVYNSSKHAVLALSESLAVELALQDAQVKVSVLCPGGVNTRILDADRNRPAALRDPGDTAHDTTGVIEARMRRGLTAAMDPARVADSVIAGIREEAFYIFSHPDVREWVRAHADGVIEGHGPVVQGSMRQMLRRNAACGMGNAEW